MEPTGYDVLVPGNSVGNEVESAPDAAAIHVDEVQKLETLAIVRAALERRKSIGHEEEDEHIASSDESPVVAGAAAHVAGAAGGHAGAGAPINAAVEGAEAAGAPVVPARKSPLTVAPAPSAAAAPKSSMSPASAAAAGAGGAGKHGHGHGHHGGGAAIAPLSVGESSGASAAGTKLPHGAHPHPMLHRAQSAQVPVISDSIMAPVSAMDNKAKKSEW